MIRKILFSLLSVTAVLAGAALFMYLTNTAPEVPALTAEEASSGKPYVVKLHAQWCPVCMVTKGVWSEIEDGYAGRVNLLVLDFTDDTTTAASEAVARRLGLEDFYRDYAGWTGAIAVLDGRTREVLTVLDGIRDFADYSGAIDAAFAAP